MNEHTQAQTKLSQPNPFQSNSFYPITTSAAPCWKQMNKVLQVNLVAEQEGEGVLHRACRGGAVEEGDHLWE